MAAAPVAHSRFASIEGLHLHYLHAGSGSPVVLVHGIAASVVDWHLTIPALTARFAVTALDLPGFGESAIPPRGFGIPDAVRVLDGLLDLLGIEAAAFVGNSMGGLICGHYAIARPRRVSRLLLVNPAGIGRDLSLHFRLLCLPLLGSWALRPRRNAGKLVAAGLFADPSRAPAAWLIDKEVDRGAAARRYMLRSLRGGATVFGLRRELLLLDGLRRLDIPTMVVWGAKDRVIPPQHLGLVRAHLPHAATHVFPDAGHVPMLECPEEFNQLALGFLAPLLAPSQMSP